MKITKNTIGILSFSEKERINECLKACAGLLQDPDTHLYIGLTDQELEKIIENWPSNSNNKNTLLAVINCLNLLIYGWDLPWDELGINESYQNMKDIYSRLRGEKRLPPIYSKQELITYIAKGHTPEYIFFWGSKGKAIENNCLSQFYPVHFAIDGIIYKSAEQYYMAQKARFFDDQESLQKIIKSKSPLEAKKLGRNVKNFDENQWQQVRFEIVVQGNKHKFMQNSKLGNYLQSTCGKILIEASPHDAIWGIGLSQDDPDVHDPEKWPGENLLGFALMKVRDEIC